MNADTDITRWIRQLGRGDETAAQRIWERYFDRLVRLVRERLDGSPRRAADEEDVALSALHSCFRGVTAGRYPLLVDREDLWRVLVTISAHKALDQMRAARAAKRGAGRVRGESVFDDSRNVPQRRGIERVVGEAPTPEFAATTAETCRELLDGLDDSLRTVVVYRLEGYSNVEIARKLDCSLRTVERKLARVRQQWGRLTDERETEPAEPERIDR